MKKFFKNKAKLALLIAFTFVFSLALQLNSKLVYAEETNLQYKQIDILSFNDFHGALEENGKNVGAAKLAGAIDEARKANPNSIVVCAGDAFQGSAMSNLTYGKPVTDVFNSIGIKYSALGNHEFDWGDEHLVSWQQEGNFKFLASNVYDRRTGKPVEWAEPYAVEEIDGIKVGFVGIATPETAVKTKPENVKNYEFKDPSEAAQVWIDHLRNVEKVDVVIALTHIGSIQDQNGVITGEAADLANNVKGLDGIISSHTHQKVSGKVNNVPIVQAMHNGRALGKLSIKVDKDNKISSIEPSVDVLYERKDLVENGEVKSLIEKYNDELKPILDEKVADLLVDLPHDRREGLSPLGELTAKYMAMSAGAQIGITNGGGIRAPLSKGKITMGDMYMIMPFDNTLVTMDLKGSDIKKNLEHGIANEKYGWVQFYGVRAYYDKEKPSGERISYMELLDGTPVEMDKYYKVVTNDFMAEGGDEFDFSGGKNVLDTGKPIRDGMVEIMKKEGTIDYKSQGLLVDGKKPETNPEVNPEVKPDINTDNSNENKEILPQTGSAFGANEFITLGTIVTLLGSAMFVRSRKDKEEEAA
ncbi:MULTISPECIES: 5'-nucleotidase C-terminal domain-containing protein [Clostridium]|uniref:5'-nucleotidase C-terminal domain-containing protein n=1 Tax=Clostridium faecium TaxID=2762223 RepID=A0ABR8YWU6_9CLOT|nr:MULTISPECIES: 5'-nucleotidase C-terminal domain-containing protein [Clostridium]MBD8048742.1 5'-nucleotidase C-terminal domain-containing protein [Clostridium faecium]MDU1350136.1 5'-nucleotidase C-terminal domain-containing protein [Clostridium argentinense]